MGLIRFESSFPRYSPGVGQPRANGFDPDGTYQMVPYGGERFLHVEAIGVEGWSLKVINSSLVSVSAVPQGRGNDERKFNVFRVKGLHPGSAFIIARGPDREELARIEIEVKLQRKLFIRFLLVSDKAGHHTTFSEKDTAAWTKFINETVFEPQVNVHFRHLSTERITIYEDLGDSINFEAIGLMPFIKRGDGEASRIWHLITDPHGMLDPHVFNVFCVWDFRNKSDGGDDNAAFVSSNAPVTAAEMEKSGVNFNMCMFRQKGSKDSYYKFVLSHEAGHYLNRIPFHTSEDELLMTPGTAGILLRKPDVKRMNPG